MHFRLFPVYVLSVVVLIFAFGCGSKKNKVQRQIQTVIDNTQSRYAPDGRVAIFDIEAKKTKEQWSVVGVSDQPTAVKALMDSIASKGIRASNKVRVLPDSTVGDSLFAVVNNSVANLRSNPKHSAELATQVLLGTLLKVKEIKGEWYRVQGPDGYIAWVDHGGVQLVNAVDAVSWKNADKIIVTDLVADVKVSPGSKKVVSDVVLGNKLKLTSIENGYYAVVYPDGREGIINKRSASRYGEWKTEVVPDADLIEKYAYQLMGVPYLWGGTSTKGVDCSGFTKTVYMMNGRVIPRDASQQVLGGLPVEIGMNYEGLQKGDLLFFGRVATDSTRQKTTHVGIWLDDMKFIHSSERVRISSFDPESEYYDEINKNRFLEARRYLGQNVPGTSIY